MTELVVPEPGFAGSIGVARRVITPPLAVPVRSWGPATDDFATGIHRPMTLTAISFVEDGEQPLVLVAADLGWFKSPEDEANVRAGVLDAAGGDATRVLVNLSHTHAGPSGSLTDGDEATRRYLHAVRAAAGEAAREAIASAGPATLSCTVGRCDLAANRDLDDDGRYVVGFNPGATADDTVVVGRIVRTDGTLLAVLVNYACHPTTLAWQNRLVSPDFVGAAREVVERALPGTLCAFLQGACRRARPPSPVRRRHRRRRPARPLPRLRRHVGPRTDGARRARHSPTRASSSRVLRSACGSRCRTSRRVGSRRSPSRSSSRSGGWQRSRSSSRSGRGSTPSASRSACAARAASATTTTAATPTRSRSGSGGSANASWSASRGSRTRCSRPSCARAIQDRAVFVLGVTNAEMSAYLPVEGAYGHDVYQAWQTPYERGCLERVLEAVDEAVGRLSGARPPA